MKKRQKKKNDKKYMFNKALLQGYPKKGLKRFISILYCNRETIFLMKDALEIKLFGLKAFNE